MNELRNPKITEIPPKNSQAKNKTLSPQTNIDKKAMKRYQKIIQKNK